MIEVQNLTKQYGNIKAVDNISFTVDKGEVLGLLGPNGAGKSTTMNTITGFIPPTEGSIRIDGLDIMEKPQEVKKKIGYLPEQPPLYMDMTVFEYLNFVCELKQVEKSKRKSQMADIMELVRISHVKDRLIKNLSKGYKQRVGMAQAMTGSPEVLILDEPTVGLDPKQIIEIRNLIKALGKEHTIILSSHILPEVSAVCEKVIIINKGKIAAIDTPQNLSKGFGSSTRFNLRVAGPKAEIQNTLKEIQGVSYIEAHGQKEEGSTDFIIEAQKDVDIRKPVFFELARLGFPILELKSMALSLEDIFLQITTEEKEVAEDGSDI